jgi:hypothetical protein
MPHSRFPAGNDNRDSDALALVSMPARARALASQCGSEKVAGLLEMHARLCECNLQASSGKLRLRGAKPTEIV